MNRRLGILVSGRGSNLQAIIDAIGDGRLDAQIALVLSSRPEAHALDRARAAGIEAVCLSPRAFATPAAHDAALVEALSARNVGLVCLAGYMRVLGPGVLRAFPDAVLNIHPSLLPAFPGLDAQRQAWTHGVTVAGATVHLVTATVDDGPIVLQAAVPVRDDDSAESLAARVLAVEHRLYPDAIGLVLEGGWRIEGRRFIRRATDDRAPDGRA